MKSGRVCVAELFHRGTFYIMQAKDQTLKSSFKAFQIVFKSMYEFVCLSPLKKNNI